MENHQKEGQNYLRHPYNQDAAFQSEAEKKKNLQQDLQQNGEDANPTDKPQTNTTLGSGNHLEGDAENPERELDKLNP